MRFFIFFEFFVLLFIINKYVALEVFLTNVLRTKILKFLWNFKNFKLLSPLHFFRINNEIVILRLQYLDAIQTIVICLKNQFSKFMQPCNCRNNRNLW